MKPTRAQVNEVLVRELGVKPEDVTPDANIIADLGADSLDTVEIVMALEEEFDIQITDEEAERCGPTVADLYAALGCGDE